MERPYLSDPAGVELIPGAAAALRRLQEAGTALVVVTNQSGIARGLFDEAAYHRVQQRLEALLDAEGVSLDDVRFCPHHPDFSGPCECRKPGLRLFREAAETLDIDLGRSIFVGDRVSDVAPALVFGATPILVLTGYGAGQRSSAPAGTLFAADLADAARRWLEAGQIR